MNVQADGFPAGFVRPKIGGLHDAGASAGGNHETVSAGGNLNGPFGQHVSQAARVFVVTGHVDAGVGALEILFQLSGGACGMILSIAASVLAGLLMTLKAGGTEEDDGVLNLLAAKPRQGFLVFGHDAEDAPVRAVEERMDFRYARGADLRWSVITKLAIEALVRSAGHRIPERLMGTWAARFGSGPPDYDPLCGIRAECYRCSW